MSRFTVHGFATGLLSAFGHNPTIAIRDFEGEVLFSPEVLPQAKLHLIIFAASLAVENQISDKDRREMERQMQEQVLEISRFPQIIYECFSVSGSQKDQDRYTVMLNGKLTLHGVTRIQPVEAQVSTPGNMLRASGEFAIRQSDYGIKLVTALGGALKLKDDLKLVFDLAARKQAAASE